MLTLDAQHLLLKVFDMTRLKLFLFLINFFFSVSSANSGQATDIGNYDRPIPSSKKEIQADISLLASLETDQLQVDIPEPEAGHAYDLAELIDIAQQRNPATRQAWLQIREAARQAEIIQSALLPIVAAAAITGKQYFNNTIDLPLIGSHEVDSTAEGVAGIITANWLLFDFGENDARQQAANNLAKISGFTFNRMHQELVFDVAQAFYTHDAALKKMKYAQQATQRAEQLVYNATRRKDAGVGNTVEVAQSRQLLAQTRLLERIATGEANVSEVSLASVLSLPPSTQILLKPSSTSLPGIGDLTMEATIDAALISRPGVQASLAKVRAAQSNIDAIAASYLPKVMLGASLSVGNAGFDIYGFSMDNIGPTQSRGVLIGVSVPIYDGYLRSHKKRNAQDALAAARSGVAVAKAAASREIAVAYEGLRTALAVNLAAQELVDASNVTADAAQKAYVNGVGTISDASRATLGLYTATEALIDSRRAAHHAAATLALALGK